MEGRVQPARGSLTWSRPGVAVSRSRKSLMISTVQISVLPGVYVQESSLPDAFTEFTPEKIKLLDDFSPLSIDYNHLCL